MILHCLFYPFLYKRPPLLMGRENTNDVAYLLYEGINRSTL